MDFESYTDIARNIFYLNRYNKNTTELCVDATTVFINGKWAEIIETISKEQAEKELGKKIVG